jgi:hypothetical protein
MKRSVRNGIAIAGMAGGMWLLGQAVAQADQVNNTGQDNTQSSTSEDGGGTTGNVAGNFNESSNEYKLDVETNVSGGNGGSNTSNVNTGVQGAIIVVESNGSSQAPVYQESSSSSSNGSRGGDAEGEIEIETHSVYVEQNANGGSVHGSGNISDLPDAPNQTNNVSQSNHQTASSEDGHKWWPRHDDKEQMKSRGMGGGWGGLTGNLAGNFNESENEIEIDLETNVYGGDGGYNDSNVNTGIQLALLACKAEYGGDAECEVDIETGSVTVIQNANGGSVYGSGNIVDSHGRNHHDNHAPGKGHEHKPGVSPAAAPAAKHAGSSAAVSSAQPAKGELAFTGSDIGLPLVLGLMALGLGGALTLAGRRRVTSTM